MASSLRSKAPLKIYQLTRVVFFLSICVRSMPQEQPPCIMAMLCPPPAGLPRAERHKLGKGCTGISIDASIK